MYRAEVRIELKPGVADPEGTNTKKALELLGFSGVQAVRSVHAFAIDLDAASPEKAKAAVDEMCKRLLVNPVIHAPRVSLLVGNGAAPKPARKAKAASRPARGKAKPKQTRRKR
jgi:phosphoribosylformylglycinamidine synthase